ncbi:MAG: AAA family ATPase [Prevotella sp.]|uniref:AAA family ATPase n=1 Tax=Prevotella sp. TaxID=59823 RepID=UPI002A29131E|nr:AAA family ATPase [Prevotella sp.]MDD7317354.1 AAA family ATPase [Prevotellaceae bacterium]MDY4019452.1 AAA family ATPase [Prevotella sp.]
MQHLEKGYLIDEKYTVAMFLKEGMCNENYRVLDDNGTSFFMKLFDMQRVPKLLVDSEFGVKEIAVYHKLQCGGMSRLHADGLIEIEGQRFCYLITDYFGGELLSEVISRRQTLDAQEALRYTLAIAEGLKEMHAVGLVHNDITPCNIIFTEVSAKAKARIIDLGHTCEPIDGQPPFFTSDLDPFCRAPETYNNVYNMAGDVFSLAAVAYTMLTGKMPWQYDISDPVDVEKIRNTLRAKRIMTPPEIPEKENLTEHFRDAITQTLKASEKKRMTLEQFVDAIQGKKPVKKAEVRSEKRQAETESRYEIDDEMRVGVEAERRNGNGFDGVAGMEELKKMMREKIIFVLKNKDLAEKYKLTPPNGMLLYGPPGCGKTFFAEKFAEESGFNFINIKSSDLGSTYIHGTQGKIAELFRKAEEKTPTVICFDEFDALVPNRSGIDNNNLSGEVNEFLSQLNNCAKRGLFVICTSNRPDKIDPAVLRTGRIDKMVYVPMPDEKARREMFRLHLAGRPCKDIDCDRLAKLTENYISSDISFIVNDSAITAALSDSMITQELMENCIRCNRPSLSPETVKSYERMREMFGETVAGNARPHIGFK